WMAKASDYYRILLDSGVGLDDGTEASVRSLVSAARRFTSVKARPELKAFADSLVRMTKKETSPVDGPTAIGPDKNAAPSIKRVIDLRTRRPRPGNPNDTNPRGMRSALVQIPTMNVRVESPAYESWKTHLKARYGARVEQLAETSGKFDASSLARNLAAEAGLPAKNVYAASTASNGHDGAEPIVYHPDGPTLVLEGMAQEILRLEQDLVLKDSLHGSFLESFLDQMSDRIRFELFNDPDLLKKPTEQINWRQVSDVAHRKVTGATKGLESALLIASKLQKTPEQHVTYRYELGPEDEFKSATVTIFPLTKLSDESPNGEPIHKLPIKVTFDSTGKISVSQALAANKREHKMNIHVGKGYGARSYAEPEHSFRPSAELASAGAAVAEIAREIANPGAPTNGGNGHRSPGVGQRNGPSNPPRPSREVVVAARAVSRGNGGGAADADVKLRHPSFDPPAAVSPEQPYLALGSVRELARLQPNRWLPIWLQQAFRRVTERFGKSRLSMVRGKNGFKVGAEVIPRSGEGAVHFIPRTAAIDLERNPSHIWGYGDWLATNHQSHRALSRTMNGNSVEYTGNEIRHAAEAFAVKKAANPALTFAQSTQGTIVLNPDGVPKGYLASLGVGVVTGEKNGNRRIHSELWLNPSRVNLARTRVAPPSTIVIAPAPKAKNPIIEARTLADEAIRGNEIALRAIFLDPENFETRLYRVDAQGNPVRKRPGPKHEFWWGRIADEIVRRAEENADPVARQALQNAAPIVKGMLSGDDVLPFKVVSRFRALVARTAILTGRVDADTPEQSQTITRLDRKLFEKIAAKIDVDEEALRVAQDRRRIADERLAITQREADEVLAWEEKAEREAAEELALKEKAEAETAKPAPPNDVLETYRKEFVPSEDKVIPPYELDVGGTRNPSRIDPATMIPAPAIAPGWREHNSIAPEGRSSAGDERGFASSDIPANGGQGIPYIMGFLGGERRSPRPLPDNYSLVRGFAHSRKKSTPRNVVRVQFGDPRRSELESVDPDHVFYHANSGDLVFEFENTRNVDALKTLHERTLEASFVEGPVDGNARFRFFVQAFDDPVQAVKRAGGGFMGFRLKPGYQKATWNQVNTLRDWLMENPATRALPFHVGGQIHGMSARTFRDLVDTYWDRTTRSEGGIRSFHEETGRRYRKGEARIPFERFFNKETRGHIDPRLLNPEFLASHKIGVWETSIPLELDPFDVPGPCQWIVPEAIDSERVVWGSDKAMLRTMKEAQSAIPDQDRTVVGIDAQLRMLITRALNGDRNAAVKFSKSFAETQDWYVAEDGFPTKFIGSAKAGEPKLWEWMADISSRRASLFASAPSAVHLTQTAQLLREKLETIPKNGAAEKQKDPEDRRGLLYPFEPEPPPSKPEPPKGGGTGDPQACAGGCATDSAPPAVSMVDGRSDSTQLQRGFASGAEGGKGPASNSLTLPRQITGFGTKSSERKGTRYLLADSLEPPAVTPARDPRSFVVPFETSTGVSSLDVHRQSLALLYTLGKLKKLRPGEPIDLLIVRNDLQPADREAFLDAVSRIIKIDRALLNGVVTDSELKEKFHDYPKGLLVLTPEHGGTFDEIPQPKVHLYDEHYRGPAEEHIVTLLSRSRHPAWENIEKDVRRRTRSGGSLVWPRKSAKVQELRTSPGWWNIRVDTRDPLSPTIAELLEKNYPRAGLSDWGRFVRTYAPEVPNGYVARLVHNAMDVDSTDFRQRTRVPGSPLSLGEFIRSRYPEVPIAVLAHQASLTMERVCWEISDILPQDPQSLGRSLSPITSEMVLDIQERYHESSISDLARRHGISERQVLKLIQQDIRRRRTVTISIRDRQLRIRDGRHELSVPLSYGFPHLTSVAVSIEALPESEVVDIRSNEFSAWKAEIKKFPGVPVEVVVVDPTKEPWFKDVVLSDGAVRPVLASTRVEQIGPGKGYRVVVRVTPRPPRSTLHHETGRVAQAQEMLTKFPGAQVSKLFESMNKAVGSSEPRLAQLIDFEMDKKAIETRATLLTKSPAEGVRQVLDQVKSGKSFLSDNIHLMLHGKTPPATLAARVVPAGFDPRRSLETTRAPSPSSPLVSGAIHYGIPKITADLLWKGTDIVLDGRLKELGRFQTWSELSQKMPEYLPDVGQEYLELHLAGTAADASLLGAHSALRSLFPSLEPLGSLGIHGNIYGRTAGMFLVLAVIQAAHGGQPFKDLKTVSHSVGQIMAFQESLTFL
ncbi:MAG TPA: hypothetical protein VI895_12955, partial [Bdellovibrionota bacterium]|nr:hypothetical protein [Bdellovibrionota bacterium]